MKNMLAISHSDLVWTKENSSRPLRSKLNIVPNRPSTIHNVYIWRAERKRTLDWMDILPNALLFVGKERDITHTQSQ